MRQSIISIEVSPKIAASFLAASPERQAVARELVEALFAPRRQGSGLKFLKLREQAVRAAQKTGLTAEKLTEIIDEAS
jgi:hypothetical protein